MADFLRFTGFLVKNDILNRLNEFKSSRYRAKKLGANLVNGNTIPKKFSAQSRLNRVIFCKNLKKWPFLGHFWAVNRPNNSHGLR